MISVGSIEVGAEMESTESGSASGSAESGAGLGVIGTGLGSTAFSVGFCTIAAGLGEAEIHAPDAQRSRTTACCAIASEADARMTTKTLALAAHGPRHQDFWSVANSIRRTFVGIRIWDYTCENDVAYKIFRSVDSQPRSAAL